MIDDTRRMREVAPARTASVTSASGCGCSQVVELPALAGVERVEAHQDVLCRVEEVDAKVVRGVRDLEHAVLLVGCIAGAFNRDF